MEKRFSSSFKRKQEHSRVLTPIYMSESSDSSLWLWRWIIEIRGSILWTRGRCNYRSKYFIYHHGCKYSKILLIQCTMYFIHRRLHLLLVIYDLRLLLLLLLLYGGEPSDGTKVRSRRSLFRTKLSFFEKTLKNAKRPKS